MKTMFALLATVGVLPLAGLSVTMYDADFYMRGMGTDSNHDGIVQATEFRDALGKISDALFTGNWKWSISNGSKVIYTNEWVYLPYRGVRRQLQGIYLPQQLTYDGSGNPVSGYPNTIKPYAYLFNRITQNSNNFTIHMRFKPDLDQPLGGDKSFALFAFGYDQNDNKGIRVIANNVTDVETPVWGEGYTGQKVKTRVATPYIQFGQAGVWTPSANCRIGLGVWNDIILSYTGDKLALLVCRDGHFFGDKDYRDTAVNGYNTYWLCS